METMNVYYAYLYKVEGNRTTRSVITSNEKSLIISSCINRAGSFDYAMVISEKQRNDRVRFLEFYQKAKTNKGITLFIEPTSLRQLQYCNVDLSYYKHQLRNV